MWLRCKEDKRRFAAHRPFKERPVFAQAPRVPGRFRRQPPFPPEVTRPAPPVACARSGPSGPGASRSRAARSAGAGGARGARLRHGCPGVRACRRPPGRVRRSGGPRRGVSRSTRHPSRARLPRDRRQVLGERSHARALHGLRGPMRGARRRRGQPDGRVLEEPTTSIGVGVAPECPAGSAMAREGSTPPARTCRGHRAGRHSKRFPRPVRAMSPPAILP